MYLLNLGVWNAVFAVPCAVVDQYIKIASPNQLKVLLWVLRHADHGFEAKEPAQALGLSEDAVGEALLFWQQEAGLLASSGVELKPAASNAQTAPVEGPAVWPSPRLPPPLCRTLRPPSLPKRGLRRSSPARRSRTMRLLPSGWRNRRKSLT
ncbi:hypothetical protein [Anaeromassilibacillus sp. SJQ-1]|uniref:hypothetical protein n=1 Tax=Anaeromassilibacillus sp. SJQ-1 TaxID=3375419 RepID=UPI003989F593